MLGPDWKLSPLNSGSVDSLQLRPPSMVRYWIWRPLLDSEATRIWFGSPGNIRMSEVYRCCDDGCDTRKLGPTTPAAQMAATDAAVRMARRPATLRMSLLPLSVGLLSLQRVLRRGKSA